MKSFQEFWHYHSDAPKNRRAGKEAPAGIQPLALADDGKDYLEFGLITQKYRPTHQVTLRTNVDGWGRDILGVYWSGAWSFALPKEDYKAGGQYLFYLNGIRQEGEPRPFTSLQKTYLNEGDVAFPPQEDRFQHGYENLRASDDEQQQNLIRSKFAESIVWDVIIIGSGMGGGVLADALTDQTKLNVLVLDAGSLNYPTHIENLPVTGLGSVISGNQVRHYKNVDDDQHFGEYVQMGLGGRSVYWSGLIPRMKAWELRHWPASIRRYLTNGGYDAAEKLMRKYVYAGRFQEETIEKLRERFPQFTVVGTPRSCHQPEFGTADNPRQQPESFLYRSTGTFSAAELLLDSMTAYHDPGKGRLFINLNHLVTRLEQTPPKVDAGGKVTEEGEVTRVHCQDLVGNCSRIYRGNLVVLAAGSLESVKIALNSKLADPAKLIGKGLTDHPSYYAPDGYFQAPPFRLKSTSPFAGPYKHARIFFYPENPWEGFWFNVEIVLNGQFWRTRHADDDVLEGQHPPDAPSEVHFKFVFGSEIQEGNSVELGPDPNGLLRVRHAKNPTGAEARPAVVNLIKQFLEFFQVEGEIDFSLEGNCHFGNGGTVNHAGATLRMDRPDTSGPNAPDKPGVVDENLKFHAYRNLYVCDPSVYPFIPAANPSLTLTALALRLANHIGEQGK